MGYATVCVQYTFRYRDIDAYRKSIADLVFSLLRTNVFLVECKLQVAAPQELKPEYLITMVSVSFPVISELEYKISI